MYYYRLLSSMKWCTEQCGIYTQRKAGKTDNNTSGSYYICMLDSHKISQNSEYRAWNK